MIVEKLELRDFLSHKETAISFGRGLTAIIGPNGAGKSSLIEGIVYSLFQDSFRNLRGGTKDSLKRIGARSAFVKLTFNVAGRRFKVERFIGASTADCLYEEDKLIATQASVVDKKTLEILGIPRKEAYLNTVVVKQGELENVLEAFTKASGREDLLRAMGFKELEDIAEALKEERGSFEKKYMDLMLEASKLESLKKQMEKQMDELRRLDDERVKVLENLKVLEKGLSYIDKTLADLPESLESNLSSLQARYYELRSSVELVDGELNRLKQRLEDIQRLKKELEGLRSVLGFKEKLNYLLRISEKAITIYSRLEQLRSAIHELEEGINNKLRFLAQVLQCPPDVDLVMKAYEDLRAKIKQKESLTSGLRTVIEEKRAMLSSLERSGESCPLCGAKLTDEAKSRVREKLEREVKEAALELERESMILSDLRGLLGKVEKVNVVGLIDELNMLSEKRMRGNEEERRYLDCMSDVNRVLEEILSSDVSGDITSRLRELINVVELPSEVIKIVRELADFTGRVEGRAEELSKAILEEVDVKDRIRELEDKKASTLNEVARLEKEIEEVRRKVDARRKLIEERNKIERQIAESRGRLSSIEESIKRSRAVIDELKELYRKAEEAEREAARIRSFMEFIDFLRTKVFGKDGLVAKQLRVAYRAKLDSEVNNYLSRFGMDFEVEFDEQLNLKVKLRGEERDINNLSGGERAVLALSTRLALAKALSSKEIELLILDEPTANLDVDRRRELVRVLRELTDDVPQVIVVTHDPEIAETADQVYRVKKVSGVSIVEEE